MRIDVLADCYKYEKLKLMAIVLRKFSRVHPDFKITLLKNWETKKILATLFRNVKFSGNHWRMNVFGSQ